ncbi:MAG: penicillin-binding transpeptidase domain-containing protein [Patescibacteria group bacterium]|nr:penicillin-binding transpeptidase domain-containing protein [Patescibacteria group bacterium]
MIKVGAAFPDFIKQEKPSHRIKTDFENSSDHSRNIRGYVLLLSLFLLLFLIFIKLLSIQVFRGNYYRNLSDSNRIKTNIVHAPRGTIFDRNGAPLVFNIPGFREKIKDKSIPLTREEALPLIASGKKDLEIDSLRQYPYKEIFSHVLGYTGQISKEELKDSKFSNYHPDDFVGKTGIEKSYEKKLKGVDGKQLIEVDTTGKAIRTLGQTDPISGENVYLTLDVKLQQSAFDAMKDVKKGALIVSTSKGEILALVSKPSFDPNLFTLGDEYKPDSNSTYQNITQVLLDSSDQPLINRAISGQFPPGSTFKIVNAAAGLENKVIDENFKIEDTGILKIGNFSFANWYFTQYGKTEGWINIVDAIKRSNDIFFYKSAEMVGIDKMSFMANKFGLGQKLGIDLTGEEKGLVPTEEWKKETIGEPWYLGDTYHYGIGQGYLLTTPLQINAMTEVISNGGILYEPHLLKNKKPVIKNQNFLSGKTISLIQQGMEESCKEGGVAWPLFEFRVQNSELRIDGRNFLEVNSSSGSADMRKVSIACKTGTAEHGDEKTLPHAWVTIFAPAYNPQVVVTVLAESSGEGSNVAAPIAKKVLENYFSK